MALLFLSILILLHFFSCTFLPTFYLLAFCAHIIFFSLCFLDVLFFLVFFFFKKLLYTSEKFPLTYIPVTNYFSNMLLNPYLQFFILSLCFWILGFGIFPVFSYVFFFFSLYLFEHSKYIYLIMCLVPSLFVSPECLFLLCVVSLGFCIYAVLFLIYHFSFAW